MLADYPDIQRSYIHKELGNRIINFAVTRDDKQYNIDVGGLIVHLVTKKGAAGRRNLLRQDG